MDGAVPDQEDKAFPLQVEINPHIDETDDILPFNPNSPCRQDYIHIQVFPQIWLSLQNFCVEL